MEKNSDIFLGMMSVAADHARLHAAGLELLQKMVKKYYGPDIREEENAVSLMEGGKPYLTSHPEIHFNISHSGEKVVCVAGSVPVGIDIQIMRKAAYERIAEKTFSMEETADFQSHLHVSEEEGIRSFYRYWTKKESYVKFTGTGIRVDLNKLDYSGASFVEPEAGHGYVLTICVPETWEGNIVKYEESSV